jgi:hypothetical protein
MRITTFDMIRCADIVICVLEITGRMSRGSMHRRNLANTSNKIKVSVKHNPKKFNYENLGWLHVSTYYKPEHVATLEFHN